MASEIFRHWMAKISAVSVLLIQSLGSKPMPRISQGQSFLLKQEKLEINPKSL